MLGFNSIFFETYNLFKVRTKYGIYEAYAVFRKNGVSEDLSDQPNESYYVDIDKPNECYHNFEDFLLYIFLTFGKFEIISYMHDLRRLKHDLLNKKILRNEKEI